MDLSVLFNSENEDQSFDENIDPEDFLPDSIKISSRLNGEDAKVSGNAADNPVLVELDRGNQLKIKLVKKYLSSVRKLRKKFKKKNSKKMKF